MNASTQIFTHFISEIDFYDLVHNLGAGLHLELSNQSIKFLYWAFTIIDMGLPIDRSQTPFLFILRALSGKRCFLRYTSGDAPLQQRMVAEVVPPQTGRHRRNAGTADGISAPLPRGARNDYHDLSRGLDLNRRPSDKPAH